MQFYTFSCKNTDGSILSRSHAYMLYKKFNITAIADIRRTRNRYPPRQEWSSYRLEKDCYTHGYTYIIAAACVPHYRLFSMLRYGIPTDCPDHTQRRYYDNIAEAEICRNLAKCRRKGHPRRLMKPHEYAVQYRQRIKDNGGLNLAERLIIQYAPLVFLDGEYAGHTETRCILAEELTKRNHQVIHIN